MSPVCFLANHTLADYRWRYIHLSAFLSVSIYTFVGEISNQAATVIVVDLFIPICASLLTTALSLDTGGLYNLTDQFDDDLSIKTSHISIIILLKL